MSKLTEERVMELIKEVQGGTKSGDKKKEPKVEADLSKAVKELGGSIAKAMQEAMGKQSEAEKKVKEDLLNVEKGLPGIKYPELDVVGNWVKAYKESVDPQVKKEASDNIIVSFFKAWANYDKDEQAYRVFKALNEGTSAEGGYLVPSPLAAEVWRVLPDYAVMRKIARIVPMASQTLALNSLAARPYAYWVSEYAEKTTTSAEFDQKTLTAYKLVCLLPVTHELLQDANIDLASYVVRLFAEAIGIAEDRAFFIGNGTSQPRGINQETVNTTVAAGATLNFDDIIDLIYGVPQAVRTSNGAAIVGNQTAVKYLRKVKDSNNDYIWRDGGMFGGEIRSKVGRPVATVYGYPFYEQNDLGREIYFGDWKYYIIGDRKKITVSKTDEGGDAWRRDATEFKAVQRVAGRAAMTTPFAKITF